MSRSGLIGERYVNKGNKHIIKILKDKKFGYTFNRLFKKEKRTK